MARLNTRTSATPQITRASTTDSLYRDPTPASRLNGGSTARQSSYSVVSPAVSSQFSDKENEQPASREATPLAKSRGVPTNSRNTQRLMTPDSGNANKRRRTGDYNIGTQGRRDDEDGGVPIFQDEQSEEQSDEQSDEQDQRPLTPDEEEDARYYDPDQDPEERRMVSALVRDHHREVLDDRNEILSKHGNDLVTHVNRANKNLGKIKQTGLAVQDSRLMVTMTDIAGKALNATLNNNNAGIGVDIDQFVSRCIYFMKEGHPAGAGADGATQQGTRRRQMRVEEEDEDEDEGSEGLDWAFLGRRACFPCNKRPPVPSFLLGPLSVQKRVRNVTRRAKSQRQPLGPATRPQEVRQEDIRQSENSNLTHLVKTIRTRLSSHIEQGSSKIEEELNEIEDPDDEDHFAACNRHRVYSTPDDEPAVSLFDFAINPASFGQTVENLFYISFLIREGNARILMDNDSLPLLVPAAPRSLSDQRQQNVEKHQAIFSMDWPTWKELIDAFSIKEPLIPHRIPDEPVVSAGGWQS